jgi:hypothetical protein
MTTPQTIRERLDRLITLFGEDIRRMTPKARAEQLKITYELLAGNDKPEALRRIESVDYEREPVSVRRFIYDPEYLGQSLKDHIWPALVDDLVEIFEGDYSEVVLGGGIGWGKTRLMEVGLAYEIYQLSCLKNPAQHFDLIPGSTLAMVNISVDTRQAFRVLFSGLYGLIKRSPYFRNTFPYNRNLIRELRFLHQNIVAYPATASEEGVLGEGVFSAAFDEANFMEVVEKSKRSVPGDTGLYDQMQVVYQKLRDRITSRFLKHGKVPGHLWAGSSAGFPNDFTERKEAEAKTNTRIFFRRRNIYGTKPRHFFLPETFKLEVGDVGRRSRVLDGPETDVTGRIEIIPLDFKPSFLADTDRAVRDIAGYSVLSISPFILRREMIRRMFELGIAAGLQHPFSRVDAEGRPLDVTLQGRERELEYIVPERLHSIQEQLIDTLGRPLFEDAQRTKPILTRKLFPGLYWAHVDLAKGQRDKCGLVITHVMGAKRVERMDSKTLKMVEETLAITRVDLVLRIVAPPNGEVDIPSIRALFHQFRELGMQFGKITFDQYQAQESIKALNDAGFTAELFSVDDENATAYEMLKQALYDERVLCYPYSLLERELSQLERTPKKVDHPVRGSKDLADCLAAAVYHAEEGYRAGAGSLGLFQFGEVERPGQMAEQPDTLKRAQTKIILGQPLTPAEEDAITFGFDL